MQASDPLSRPKGIQINQPAAGVVPCISVIIAARNAEATIATAVVSALSQPQAAEIIVIDDASENSTYAMTLNEAGANATRLRLIRPRENIGPAAAHNIGLDKASAPIVAVLDASDRFLPGRHGRLLAERDWDIIGDDILFHQQFDTNAATHTLADGLLGKPVYLDAAGFVEGNIRRRGRPRAELGFLKPLMRKATLDAAGLRYDPKLRRGCGVSNDQRCRRLFDGRRISSRSGSAS